MKYKNTLIDLSCMLFLIGLVINGMTSNAYAFNKLKNGFENMTTTYLVPLSGVVAGCAFILFIILSYFKQEEYQKKVGNVLALAILSAVGLDLIKGIINSFS